MGLLSWLFGRRKISAAEAPKAQSSSTAITGQTDDQLERDEREDFSEISARLRARIETSQLIHADRIDELVALLATDGRQRSNLSRATAGATVLSLEEKRALGLNTRMKYTHEFISFFRPEALAGEGAIAALSNMQGAVVSEVGRLRELERLHRSGCERARVWPLGDPDACSAIKRHRKVFPIAEAPTLPLEKCRADVCRCMFEYEPPKQRG